MLRCAHKSSRLPQNAQPLWYRQGDSNPPICALKTRGLIQLAMAARVVAAKIRATDVENRERLELSTYRVKAGYSTIELAVHGGACGVLTRNALC